MRIWGRWGWRRCHLRSRGLPQGRSGRRDRKEPRRPSRCGREGGASGGREATMEREEESRRLMVARGEWQGVRESWPESGSRGGKRPPDPAHVLAASRGSFLYVVIA